MKACTSRYPHNRNVRCQLDIPPEHKRHKAKILNAHNKSYSLYIWWDKNYKEKK